MPLGPAGYGCKPLYPQLPIKTGVLLVSEVLMAETQWELSLNNYLPHPCGKLLQLMQVLISLAKNSHGLNPSPHPHWPKLKVLGGFGELHGSRALPALPSTCAWPEYRLSVLCTPPGRYVIVFHILSNTSAEYHGKYQDISPRDSLWSGSEVTACLLLHICGEELQLHWELLWKNLGCCWHLLSLTRYLTHFLANIPSQNLEVSGGF